MGSSRALACRSRRTHVFGVMVGTAQRDVPGVWTFYEPQRGSVPKPNVVPRLRVYVGLACQNDGNPNGVAATFAHVSIIICQLVSAT
jgi:hypothetical protein